MASALVRSLRILELLSRETRGMSVAAVAEALNAPPSGVHRTLNELLSQGYVVQPEAHGNYSLSLKLPALGLTFLGRCGINDLAQPELDRLAETSEELVRLSVYDGNTLIWVAVSQGVRSGFKYDPSAEQGARVSPLSANGTAFLSFIPNTELLNVLSACGTSAPEINLNELLPILEETRNRGYAIAVNKCTEGMTAIAAPVLFEGRLIGTVSIAGPTYRMDEVKVERLAPELMKTADALGRISQGSKLFKGFVLSDSAKAN